MHIWSGNGVDAAGTGCGRWRGCAVGRGMVAVRCGEPGRCRFPACCFGTRIAASRSLAATSDTLDAVALGRPHLHARCPLPWAAKAHEGPIALLSAANKGEQKAAALAQASLCGRRRATDKGGACVATAARTALTRYGITPLGNLHRKPCHVTFPSAHPNNPLPSSGFNCSFISLHVSLPNSHHLPVAATPISSQSSSCSPPSTPC